MSTPAGILGLGGAERLLRVLKSDDPAVNTEATFTVQGGTILIPYAVNLQFVTDANVANRSVELIYDDGTDTFSLVPPQAVQAAGLTRDYRWIYGMGYTQSGAGSNTLLMGLPRIPLLPGFRIRTNTVNRQAGDNLSALTIYAEEVELRGDTAQLLYEITVARERAALLAGLGEEGV